MEINVKEARGKMGLLIKRVKNGEEVIILHRRKKVARLVPIDSQGKTLPSLKNFRSSISIKGKPLSNVVVEQRNEERY